MADGNLKPSNMSKNSVISTKQQNYRMSKSLKNITEQKIL